VFIGRLATSLVGTGLVISMLVRAEFGWFGYSLAFLIALATEALGRYLFYAAREASRL
jgi:DMSO reductase anchor subunit